MRPLVLSLAAALFGAAAAHAASPYPVNIERQRGETLIIEHTPSPRSSTGGGFHERELAQAAFKRLPTTMDNTSHAPRRRPRDGAGLFPARNENDIREKGPSPPRSSA